MTPLEMSLGHRKVLGVPLGPERIRGVLMVSRFGRNLSLEKGY